MISPSSPPGALRRCGSPNSSSSCESGSTAAEAAAARKNWRRESSMGGFLAANHRPAIRNALGQSSEQRRDGSVVAEGLAEVHEPVNVARSEDKAAPKLERVL